MPRIEKIEIDGVLYYLDGEEAAQRAEQAADLSGQAAMNARDYATLADNSRLSAVHAADQAKTSADEAKEAEEYIKTFETLPSDVQENRYRIQDLEKHVGFETIFQTIETSNHSTLAVPENAMRYATIEKIEGHIVGYTQYNGALECFVKNYPKQIVTDKGDVLFDESNLRESEIENLGIEGNYLYIKQGNTNAEGKPLYYFYLHTAREYHEGTSVPSTWKSIYKEFHTDGVPYAYIGNLATPTDKNVSKYASADNTFDLKGVKSIILVPKYTEAELDDMSVGENMDLYQSGTTTFVFELDHTEGV